MAYFDLVPVNSKYKQVFIDQLAGDKAETGS